MSLDKAVPADGAFTGHLVTRMEDWQVLTDTGMMTMAEARECQQRLWRSAADVREDLSPDSCRWTPGDPIL